MTTKDVKPKGPAPATLPIEQKKEDLNKSRGPDPLTLPKKQE